MINKTMKHFAYKNAFFSLFMLLVLAACSNKDAAVVVVDDTGLLLLEPAVTSIDVGGEQQYIAYYIDQAGQRSDVSEQVEWATSNATIAEIDALGLVSARSGGDVLVTASLNALKAEAKLSVVERVIQSLVVSPAEAFSLVGVNTAFSAVAIYTDGSQKNISDQAKWASSDTLIASVDGAGMATALTTGVVDITASYHGISGQGQLLVSESAIDALIIYPASPALPINSTLKLSALVEWHLLKLLSMTIFPH